MMTLLIDISFSPKENERKLRARCFPFVSLTGKWWSGGDDEGAGDVVCIRYSAETMTWTKDG